MTQNIHTHVPLNSYIRYERHDNHMTRVKVTRGWLQTGVGPRLTIVHVKEMNWSGYVPEIRSMASADLDGWGSCMVDQDAVLSPREYKEYLRETGSVKEAGTGLPCVMLDVKAFEAHHAEQHHIKAGFNPYDFNNDRFVNAAVATIVPETDEDGHLPGQTEDL